MSFKVLLVISFLAVGTWFWLVSSPSLASKHTGKTTQAPAKRTIEAHHPSGWRFTMSKGDPAAATMAAAPPLLPPGVRSRSYGFDVRP